jgi:Trypsin-like peptidase domain
VSAAPWSEALPAFAAAMDLAATAGGAGGPRAAVEVLTVVTLFASLLAVGLVTSGHSAAPPVKASPAALITRAGTTAEAQPQPLTLEQKPGLFAAADKVRGAILGIRSRTVLPVSTGEGQVLRAATASGSGFSVGPSLVLTSLHVVAVKRPDGSVETVEEIEALIPRQGAVAAHVVAVEPALDLALLKLDASVSTQTQAELSDQAPEAGELLALGVLDGGLVAVPVEQAAADPAQAPTAAAPLFLQNDLGPAFWGSPLFDESGRVAGIVVASLPGHAAAVPAMLVRKLLTREVAAQ